jgi:hypothetical protein
MDDDGNYLGLGGRTELDRGGVKHMLGNSTSRSEPLGSTSTYVPSSYASASLAPNQVAQRIANIRATIAHLETMLTAQ